MRGLITIFSSIFVFSLAFQNDVFLPHSELIPRSDVFEMKCGKNVKAILDAGTFTLKITGQGGMYDYSFFDEKFPPWYNTTYMYYILTINISDGITYIGKSAFNDLDVLSEVIIPASVETIGDSAFANCPKLTSISIDESSRLSVIGSSAFQGTGLKEITIPDSVTTIQSGAFSFCDDLYCMNIGQNESNLEKIQSRVFFKSPNLYSVTFFGNSAGTIKCEEDVFDKTEVEKIKVRKTYESEKEDETFCGKEISKVRESSLQCVEKSQIRLTLAGVYALVGVIASGFSVLFHLVCLVFDFLSFAFDFLLLIFDFLSFASDFLLLAFDFLLLDFVFLFDFLDLILLQLFLLSSFYYSILFEVFFEVSFLYYYLNLFLVVYPHFLLLLIYLFLHF